MTSLKKNAKAPRQQSKMNSWRGRWQQPWSELLGIMTILLACHTGSTNQKVTGPRTVPEVPPASAESPELRWFLSPTVHRQHSGREEELRPLKWNFSSLTIYLDEEDCPGGSTSHWGPLAFTLTHRRELTPWVTNQLPPPAPSSLFSLRFTENTPKKELRKLKYNLSKIQFKFDVGEFYFYDNIPSM